MAESSVRQLKNICVFCGSSSGYAPEFIEAAKDLGKILAKRKIHLIYRGGDLGLMGAISQVVNIGGNQVLGIIRKALTRDKIIGKTKGEELIASGMHERIIAMIEHVDAFIALPGGLGTLEKIFTIASWAQLNIHKKPIGLLDVNHYYGLLMIFLDNAMRHGFLSSSSRRIFVYAKTATELIDQLQKYQHEPNPIVSQLEWSDTESIKKRKIVYLNISL